MLSEFIHLTYNRY